MKFHVGQRVILRHRRDAEEVEIAKVGRKYVYVELYGHTLTKFDAETGYEVTPYGSPDRLYTLEEWADSLKRSDLFERLRRNGVMFDGRASRDRLTTPVLEQVLALIEQGAGA